MIDKGFFKVKFKELCILTNQVPYEDLADTLYDRLKDYHATDFESACNDREMIKEILRFKINIITIEDYIFKHRSKRLELERKEEKDNLDKKAKEFFKHQEIPEEIRKFLDSLKKL